jgi:predicted Zn-dependent protease
MKTVKIKLFILLSISLLTIIVLSGCVGMHRTVDLASISAADEAAYARAVNPLVWQRLGAIIPDESVQGYIDLVAGSLKRAEANQTFFVVNDPAPAAFVLPGGGIVVTRGLLHHLNTEAELIVILAHLIGHDLARHGMQLAAQQLPDTGETVSISGDVAAIASLHFLAEPFSDEQEIAADRYAAKILADSGFDPLPIMDLLPQIYSRLAALPDFQSEPFLRQHPLSSGRNKAAQVSVRLTQAAEPKAKNKNSLSFDEFHTTLLITKAGYDMYQQALQLEKQGAEDRAIGLYLQAAAAAPDEALILTGLGLAYMRQEALVAARQHLTRAVRLNSRYYHPQLGLGYIYLQQNDFVRAEKRLRRSQALLPTALGGYLLAKLYDDAADVHAAIKYYRLVVRHYKGSQMGALAEKRIVELSHELE